MKRKKKSPVLKSIGDSGLKSRSARRRSRSKAGSRRSIISCLRLRQSGVGVHWMLVPGAIWGGGLFTVAFLVIQCAADKGFVK